MDFAASDVILKQQDYDEYPDIHLYPMMAGGIVPIFNLGDVHELILTGEVLALIFRKCKVATCVGGSITDWGDSRITDLNPDHAAELQLAGEIHVTVRADKNGATENMKHLLGVFDADFITEVEDMSDEPNWGDIDVEKRLYDEGGGWSCTANSWFYRICGIIGSPPSRLSNGQICP